MYYITNKTNIFIHDNLIYNFIFKFFVLLDVFTAKSSSKSNGKQKKNPYNNTKKYTLKLITK